MYEVPFHTEDLSKLHIVITGSAGFIGSHLAEYFLRHNAGKITAIDDLSTGSLSNLSALPRRDRLGFHEVNINDTDALIKLFSGADLVFHNAALGSVPRSLANPLATHASNATGFLSVLEACRAANIPRLIYASSSSVYGDSNVLPKVEPVTGRPMSPYAVTKVVDEMYAELYSRIHGMKIFGLRYFNIFGPRQNPEGPYAAAIPLFILSALTGRSISVFGDGEQSRDFTFVGNAVQANVKAAFAPPGFAGKVYNIACGGQHSLNAVIRTIRELTGSELPVEHKPERRGDIRDSLASVEAAESALGYKSLVGLKEGLMVTVDWYRQNLSQYQNAISRLSGQ